VVDLGCGYGVSLLGLADNDRDASCNYLGVDMSARAVSFASRISRSWGLAERCVFVHADAFDILNDVIEQYSGPVRWISCHFPLSIQPSDLKHIRTTLCSSNNKEILKEPVTVVDLGRFSVKDLCA
jgi:SAM-dependent methyltransferase